MAGIRYEIIPVNLGSKSLHKGYRYVEYRYKGSYCTLVYLGVAWIAYQTTTVEDTCLRYGLQYNRNESEMQFFL